MTGLTVAVFSYNRGGYLRNCVESIRRNLPFAEVKVYDDNSTDPETVAVLHSLGLPVLRPEGSVTGRHGGLYANMNRALDEAGTGLILFLQEDMQLVRPVQPVELDQIAIILGAGRRAFVFPGFMKATSMPRYRRQMRADAAIRAYVGRADDPGRITYVDAMIADVGKLREVGWRFAGALLAANARMRQRRVGCLPTCPIWPTHSCFTARKCRFFATGRSPCRHGSRRA
jgi:glycosyltransferase involved in cell wall biosynthesis